MSVNPQYGVWVPGQRASAHTLHTGADRRAERRGQRARRHRPPVGGLGVGPPVQRLSVARRRPHVTVVGLGPAGTDLVGNDAAARLEAARTRPSCARPATRRPPRFEDVPSFDHLYEAAATFDEVYAGIVEALVAAALEAAPEAVVYAVPGSPLVAERTVDLLRADGRVEVTVLPALSFLDLAWARSASTRWPTAVRLVDASVFGAVAERGRPVPGGAVLVAPPALRGEARRPRRRRVHCRDRCCCTTSGSPTRWWRRSTGGSSTARVEPDHLTSLYIPASPSGGRLRRCGDGPARSPSWTRCASVAPGTRSRPTPRSCRTSSRRATRSWTRWPRWPDDGDGTGAGDDAAVADAHLQEELGDLLFQIVFHARLADEEGQFDLADVARGVHDKLVHRHPHVFGDVDADDAPSRSSRTGRRSRRARRAARSVTEGIPAGLPALMLTTKLARKARVGRPGARRRADGRGDRDDAGRADAGVPRAPIRRPDDPLSGDGGDAQVAVGELLYAVANLAQRLGVDAEQALRDRALSLRADILAAEGVPEDRGGQPLTLCPGVPPGAAPKERCREHH